MVQLCGGDMVQTRGWKNLVVNLVVKDVVHADSLWWRHGAHRWWCSLVVMWAIPTISPMQFRKAV